MIVFNQLEKNPLVTVIIPNYNHGKYLEQSIKSIKDQSYSNYEIIVIDDGSTDEETRDLVSSLSWNETECERFILLDKNHGKWYALNHAISKSSGKLIMVQDADDIAHKDKIKCQVEVMLETNSCHNLTSFTHCYSDTDLEKINEFEVPTNWLTEDVTNANETFEMCLKAKQTVGINHYVASTVEVAGGPCMYRKEVWDYGIRYQPSGYNLRTQIGEDSDFNTRVTLLLRNTNVIKLPLYGYRRNTTVLYDTKL